MKPITASDLQSILDSDLAWRRKEISSLVTLMKTAPFGVQGNLIRAAIPLLYAHWEGFGKNCFVRYMEHVSLKSIKFRKLKLPFLYLDALGIIKEAGTSGPAAGISALGRVLERNEKSNRTNYGKKLSTKSNLRQSVLSDLLIMCGIEDFPIAKYENFIDNQLCDPRNDIAHGVGGAPSLDTFLKRRDIAFELMTDLQASVVNSASLERFRSKTASHEILPTA
ncbi:hypothetical protein AMEJIAPC_00592 [Caulobacter sp. NIBR1757]|nr:hypothetical protein AMEJIAPC_00592 [Caulobacter sp. NIBR1757]